jgi:hypothetical protein
MLPQNKKDKKGKHRPASASSSSGCEAPDISLSDRSIATNAKCPAFESPPQSLPSAADPPTLLRLLLASEASAHSHSGVASAYLKCLLSSSVPDELRTPAAIVLLGAECPLCRVDRLLPSCTSLRPFHAESRLHFQVFRNIERASPCQRCFLY